MGYLALEDSHRQHNCISQSTWENDSIKLDIKTYIKLWVVKAFISKNLLSWKYSNFYIQESDGEYIQNMKRK